MRFLSGIRTIRRSATRLLFCCSTVLLFLLPAGCAKVPEGGAGPTTKRLIFTMTVERAINPNFVYMVALRPSTEENPTGQGPIPVVAPPWGNGFVAGTVTNFVRWDAAQSPRYIIYAFRDENLIDYFPIGVPINYLDFQPGTGRSIQFELDLSQIVPATEVENYRTIQVNFLTMNRVPQGNDQTPKAWDALGNGRNVAEINQWITIPLRTSGIYNNARFNDLEPPNDADDPDLEITDFSVEVRLQ